MSELQFVKKNAYTTEYQKGEYTLHQFNDDGTWCIASRYYGWLEGIFSSVEEAIASVEREKNEASTGSEDPG